MGVMRIRNTFSTTTTALATSALLVLGLAACGSGDDEAAAPAEETTTSAEAEESPAEETPAEETEEPQAEGDGADVCAASATLEEMSSEMGNIDPNNPQEGLDTLEQLTTTLEAVEAPDEIAGDWSTMATTFRSVTDGLSSALADPAAPDAMTKVSDAMSAMTEESFQQAGQNVSMYTATNC